jgi:PAS domain S-box-containing protein
MRSNNILILFLLTLLSALSGQSSDKMQLRSASELDYPPFCIVNEDGTAGGFSVELLKAACETMNLDITFRVDEWNIIKKELAEGKLDVLPLVGRTPERENLYDFTFPYMTYHGAVFARAGVTKFKTRSDLEKAKLMVMKGDNAEEYARRVKLTSDIETVESFETAFRNLSEGKCDFVVTQKVMGLNLIEVIGLTNIVPLDIEIKDFQQRFCFGLKKGNTKLLEILNEGLSVVIANGTYDRLHQKWFTPRSEIGKHKLIIAGDSAYPPFSFIDDNGKYTGPDVEISSALAKVLGLIIDLKPEKWSIVMENFHNGEYDAVMGILYSEEREEYMDFSIPYLVSEYRIFARKGTAISLNISELKKKKVAIERKNIMHEMALKAGLDKEIILTDSHEEALIKLSSGEADFALLSYLTAIHYINKNSIKNVHTGEQSLHKAEFCYAVKKGDRVLLNNINNAIANLSASGEIRKIKSKWFIEPEYKVKYAMMIKYAAAILTPILIILIGFMVWNRALAKQVEKSTKELRDEVETRRLAEELLILSEKELKEKNIQLAESEDKYRQIFESASEGIFMTKTDGTILRSNPEACKIFGCTEKEIIELGRDKLFDTEDPRFAISLEIRRKKGAFKGEVSGVRIDGTKFPVLVNSKIYRDSNGEEKTITIFSDISERKKDENRVQAYLAELEKNKNAMLNILKDVNNEVSVRKKAEEELKKLNVELEERVKERTAKLEKQNRELASAQESLVMLLEDVNETRRELEKANSKLSAANKELEAFSYSVSHDLRAPLRAILGFADILKQDYCKDLDDEGKRYIQKIVDNTSKMQNLIDDLLEYSRVGRSSIKPVMLKTVELLKKIFEEITDGEKDRKFEFSVDESIPDIQADRTLVTQLFHNIIGNAVKFTGKKDVAAIKINYENDRKFHIISVVDNGAGFDEKYKHKIFEVFQRLHSTEFPGTGVGMSIVAKVAAKHGWSLDAESKNGNGAVFYIKIPIKNKSEESNEERV